MSDKNIRGLDQSRITRLGSIGYYWLNPGGAFQSEVVISAHGGISKKAGKDLPIPPGLELRYYVQHGSTQDDFGIRKFAAGSLLPVEAPSGADMTYNYGLSKYQGRHSKGAETYSSILTQGSTAAQHNQALDEARATLPPELLKNVEGPQKLFDVVSIRNRAFSGGSDLKTILAEILKARGGNAPAIVHCFFCRSFI